MMITIKVFLIQYKKRQYKYTALSYSNFRVIFYLVFVIYKGPFKNYVTLKGG